MKWCRSQAEVVKAFLNDEDAKSGTGNLVSKVYNGIRILQHYSTIEALLYDDVIDVVVNRECWSRGFARCPDIPVPYRSLPITGLVGVLGYNLEAIRDSKEAECPIDPVPSLEWKLEHVRWVEIDGYRIGFSYGLLIDYDRQYAYIYRIVQDPWRRSRNVALMDPEFDAKIKKKMTITELIRGWRQPSLRERYINRIKSWQDLRALNNVAPVIIRIRETGRPEIRIENGVIVIETRVDVVFRVEGYHLFGGRGSVARVVALNQHDSVVGLWLVGRDVTGQLWRTVFDESFYRYSFWTLERYAMDLDPEDVIVEES